MHAAPYCRTQSVAFQPRVRSREAPLGFDPAALDTFDGTLGLLRGLVVLHLILRYSRRHASLEQPRSAYSWSYPQIPRLLAGGARLIPYDVCPFHWERLARAEQAEVRTPPGAQRLHPHIRKSSPKFTAEASSQIHGIANLSAQGPREVLEFSDTILDLRA